MIELPAIDARERDDQLSSGVRDYCGVFGVYNHPDAARLTYFGLHALQHRGQESAGIVTSTYDEVRGRPAMPYHRDFGLVLDVFRNARVFEDTLLGDAAIGHTRYSTSGSATNPANIQPFTVHYQEGNLAVGHNGNLSNARSLRAELVERGTIFNSTSDTELILHLVAQSAKRGPVERIVDALHRLRGAFTLVILTDEALIAVRDPNGFRPLAVGRVQRPDGSAAYCVASETCAFDIIGATYVRDVAPGEILIINREGINRVERGGEFDAEHMPQPYGVSPCVFEYVYFARPDSKIFGEMVDKVRRKMGKQLAQEAPPPETDDNRPPIVFSVPDSSNTAALGYVSECQKMGYDVRYEIGLIRNHYVGRTFISPGQDAREMKVRTKFNAVKGVLKDRIVVMVDDSIVRGTTAKQLIKMVRDAGAREVHFRVASSPVISPCFYGMDFPTEEELLANRFGHDVDAMRDWLGVDSLAYLSIDGMMAAARSTSSNEDFCNACFSRQYPVPVELGVVKEENEP